MADAVVAMVPFSCERREANTSDTASSSPARPTTALVLFLAQPLATTLPRKMFSAMTATP
jgi:hypothetical protein